MKTLSKYLVYATLLYGAYLFLVPQPPRAGDSGSYPRISAAEPQEMLVIVEDLDGHIVFKGTQSQAGNVFTNTRVIKVSFVVDVATGAGSAHVTVDPASPAPAVDVRLEALLEDPSLLDHIKLEVVQGERILWAGSMANIEDFADRGNIPDLKMMSGNMFFNEQNRVDRGLYRFTVE